jgi:hypothetical protein
MVHIHVDAMNINNTGAINADILTDKKYFKNNILYNGGTTR